MKHKPSITFNPSNDTKRDLNNEPNFTYRNTAGESCSWHKSGT